MRTVFYNHIFVVWPSRNEIERPTARLGGGVKETPSIMTSSCQLPRRPRASSLFFPPAWCANWLSVLTDPRASSLFLPQTWCATCLSVLTDPRASSLFFPPAWCATWLSALADRELPPGANPARIACQPSPTKSPTSLTRDWAFILFLLILSNQAASLNALNEETL